MKFNSKGVESMTYDAIVVGFGIAGGWAAKELCENGLKTLVLEHGNSKDGKEGELAVIEAYKTTSNF